MKKSKFVKSFKANWKNILSAVLVGVLLIGSVVGVTSFLNKDTKSISSTAFGVGGIDEDGNYEKSDVSIYTKDMFECQGLTIEPDFEVTGTYQVFYYGPDKNFVGATDVFNANEDVYNKGETFSVAKYARIVITPDVPVDEDGNVEEDFKIRFYEVIGFVNDYTITVNKKQNYNAKNILKDRDNQFVGLGQGAFGIEGFEPNSTSPYFWFDSIDVSHSDYLVLKVCSSTLNNSVEVLGVRYDYPVIRDFDTGDFLSGTGTNVLNSFVLQSVGEYTYICFDVSSCSKINGFVDYDSYSELEIYLL